MVARESINQMVRLLCGSIEGTKCVADIGMHAKTGNDVVGSRLNKVQIGDREYGPKNGDVNMVLSDSITKGEARKWKVMSRTWTRRRVYLLNIEPRR